MPISMPITVIAVLSFWGMACSLSLAPFVAYFCRGGARQNHRTIRNPGNGPGLQPIHNFPSATAAQAAWLKALVAPPEKGSLASAATLWPSIASSLDCSVSTSNCLRACVVHTSSISKGDFALISCFV